MSSYLNINPGSQRPFLTISQVDDTCQSSMFVFDITPDRLRRLADELEAELVKKAEAAA